MELSGIPVESPHQWHVYTVEGFEFPTTSLGGTVAVGILPQAVILLIAVVVTIISS